MMIKRLVLDTNVWISGFFWHGKPQQLVDLYRSRNLFVPVFSPELLFELREKLNHKFRVKEKDLKEWLSILTSSGDLVIPVYKTDICRDPLDNIILDTAKDAKADAIITGDKDLLVLGKFEKIPILTPAKCLKEIFDI